MTRAALCIAVLLLNQACSTLSPDRPALSRTELLSHPAFAVPPGAPISAQEAFSLDEDSRSLVAALLGDSSTRLHGLFAAMTQHGLFSLDYSELSTRTVSETFRERQGNCLSFTMLFVALARELRLDVSYRIVDVPPSWSNQTELVVIGNHVNALVKDVGGRNYVVDFNFRDFKGQYPSHAVGDDYMLALFYVNLGAEALIRKDYELAFRYLKAAIETHAPVAGGWINLGLLYTRQGYYDYAEAAYLHALEYDASNRSALSNLASLYGAIGNQPLADHYSQRVRHYQQRNPYYHYALARNAYEEQRFEDALRALRSAIRLKRNEPTFHVLQGQVYGALGKAD